MNDYTNIGQTSVPPVPQAAKLPVWKMFKECWRIIWADKKLTAQICGDVFIIVAIGSLMFYWAFGDIEVLKAQIKVRGIHWDEGVAIAILTCIIVLLYTVLAVRWHKYILRGEVARGRFSLSVTDAELKYIWKGIQLALGLVAIVVAPAIALAALGLGVVSMIVAAVALLVGLFVFYRFTLAFPAIAIGNEAVGFKESWRATENNFWRLTTLLFLVGGTVQLAGFIVALPLGVVSALLLPDAIFDQLIIVVDAFFKVLNIAFVAVSMSLSYQFLIEGKRTAPL